MSLSPKVAETVRRLSAVSGQSQSKIIGDLAEMVEPSLERVARLAEAAAAGQEEMRAGLVAAVRRADAEVVGSMTDAVAAFDAAMSDLETVAGFADPPSSNRGGR